MQDRFRFRFWDKETQTMQKFPKVELKYRITLDKIFSDDRVTFMQCTGLRDKDSKLIYEGDILLNAARHDKPLYIVRWNESQAYFCTEMINPKKYELYAKWNLGRHDLDYKVIGNIYENSELLEV